jgi:tetratricopeptide (TPR) repeat protein
MTKIAWDDVSKNAAAWEKQAQHPVLLLHLGQRYIELKRSEDAVRCIENAIAISPDAIAFKLLAAGYKGAGKMDKWQEALERYIALNPPGLEPARVRVDLAKELMRQKQWQKAKPFADAAAATGADWAMQCASECYEGLGRWDESELWIRRSTERYENSYARWFMWCKRTGHGDLAAATKVVTDRFQDVSQIAAPVDLQQMGFFYDLTGKSEQAMWAFKAWHKAEPNGDVSTLMLLLALDENDEPELRDKVVKNYPDRNKGPLDWLPVVFRESLARGEKAKLDLDAADKHIAGSAAKFQPVGCYFVGRFLEQRGHKADAIRYYRRCVDAPEVANIIFPALAINRLRVLGVKD